MEFNYENLKVSHAERNWRAGQYDIGTDYIDTYNIGFGKVIKITNSTAYKRFSCDCEELIGEHDYKLESALSRLNDNAKCIEFCLAYQYVMSNIMACGIKDKKVLKSWLAKKEQLKDELLEGKFSDPRKYFNSEEEFLQFANAAKLNKYDEMFVDQANAVEKTDKKVAMKENVKSAIQKVKAPSKKLIACISQCVALITNKIKTRQAENKAYKERTMF